VLSKQKKGPWSERERPLREGREKKGQVFPLLFRTPCFQKTISLLRSPLSRARAVKERDSLVFSLKVTMSPITPFASGAGERGREASDKARGREREEGEKLPRHLLFRSRLFSCPARLRVLLQTQKLSSVEGTPTLHSPRPNRKGRKNERKTPHGSLAVSLDTMKPFSGMRSSSRSPQHISLCSHLLMLILIGTFHLLSGEKGG
jgi:hypothetical protein